MRLAAYDSGNPDEKVYTEMMIYVNRNEFGPVFQPKTVEKSILANIGLGTELARITATDQDEVSTLSKNQKMVLVFYDGFHKKGKRYKSILYTDQ